MEQLLSFIDQLGLDETLYWRLPYQTKESTLELSWKRGTRPNSWSIREMGTDEWVALSAETLLESLPKLGIDMVAAERQLGASILTQAVFADMVLEGASRIFGTEAVEKSIKDTREFLTSVSETAKSMTRQASKGGAAMTATVERTSQKRRLKLVTEGT